jgi:hypothetical protein
MVAPEFGGLRVDKTWATQAVYNLIANALKFTRDGSVPGRRSVALSAGRVQFRNDRITRARPGPAWWAPEHAERICQLFSARLGGRSKAPVPDWPSFGKSPNGMAATLGCSPEMAAAQNLLLRSVKTNNLQGERIMSAHIGGDPPS